jgi:hypothetical protein
VTARLRLGGAKYRVVGGDEEVVDILFENIYVCMSAGRKIVEDVEIGAGINSAQISKMSIQG